MFRLDVLHMIKTEEEMKVFEGCRNKVMESSSKKEGQLVWCI
jgi:hypothetical protein